MARPSHGLERLDQTAQILASDGAAAQRLRQEGVWGGRFEVLLEGLDAAGRERAAGRLRCLLASVAASAGDLAVATGTAVAREGGCAVTGIENSSRGGRPGPGRAHQPCGPPVRTPAPSLASSTNTRSARVNSRPASVWNDAITLDRVTHLQPHAADLLRTLARYAPAGIPAALLNTGLPTRPHTTPRSAFWPPTA